MNKPASDEDEPRPASKHDWLLRGRAIFLTLPPGTRVRYDERLEFEGGQA